MGFPLCKPGKKNKSVAKGQSRALGSIPGPFPSPEEGCKTVCFTMGNGIPFPAARAVLERERKRPGMGTPAVLHFTHRLHPPCLQQPGPGGPPSPAPRFPHGHFHTPLLLLPQGRGLSPSHHFLAPARRAGNLFLASTSPLISKKTLVRSRAANPGRAHFPPCIGPKAKSWSVKGNLPEVRRLFVLPGVGQCGGPEVPRLLLPPSIIP